MHTMCTWGDYFGNQVCWKMKSEDPTEAENLQTYMLYVHWVRIKKKMNIQRS